MNQLKKLFGLSIVFLIVCMLFTLQAQAASQTGTVKCETLNLRSSASTSAKIINQLSKGDKLNILSTSGNWYTVTYGGKTGWVSKEYVTAKNATLGTGVVNVSTLNLRSKASTSSSVISKLSKGTSMTVYSKSGEWYKVTCKGKSGWVCAEYVTLGGTIAKGTLGTGTITGSVLNIRSSANTSSKVVTKVREGNKVTVLSRSGDWYKIKTSKGITGWAFGEYVSLKGTSTSRSGSRDDEGEPSDEPGDASPTASKVISYAKNYLGYDYVYGGESPSGFDCSGYVQYVMRKVDISMQRTAADQSTQGSKVRKANLKAGDLVFFGRSHIDHVGIYIGGGKFIHAANPDRGVVITSLSEDYYANRYVTARRVID